MLRCSYLVNEMITLQPNAKPISQNPKQLYFIVGSLTTCYAIFQFVTFCWLRKTGFRFLLETLAEFVNPDVELEMGRKVSTLKNYISRILI